MRLNEIMFLNYDNFINVKLEKNLRLQSFKQLLDIICKMDLAPAYVEGTINALLDECDCGFRNEKRIRLYIDELINYIGIKRNSDYMVVFSEDNIIIETLRNNYKNFSFIPLWAYVDEYSDSYDLFIQCGKDKFDINVPEEKYINLHDICFYQMCINPSSYVISSKYLKKINEAKTFVTGMSYTRNAIRGEYITGNLLSMANSSQDLYYDFACFRNAISNNPGIKNVIVGFAPYSLRYDLSKTRFDYRLYYYTGILPNYDVHNNVTLKKELKEYKRQIDIFVSVFGREIFDDLFEKVAIKSQIEGLEHRHFIFNSKNVSEEDKIEMAKKFQKPFEETLLENKQIISEYIEYALEHNVKVYLFLPPFSNWFKSNWDVNYVNELLKYIDILSEQYDFTLINLLDINLPDYYFGDYAHLNDLGSIYVSSIIDEYL